MNNKKPVFIILLSFILLHTNIFASNIPVIIDGEKASFTDAQPFITQNNRVVIPFRAVGELLNIRFDWQDRTVVATGTNIKTNEFIQVKLKNNDYQMTINNKTIAIDETLIIFNGRSYIPLRIFAEAFGYEVVWQNQTVYVNTPNVPVEPKPEESKPTPPVVEESKPVTTPSQLSVFEQEVVKLTNEFRTQNGLKPLIVDEKLSSVARLKSKDMHDLKYFDHNSPTYGSPFDMMKKYGISYRSAGENIAMQYKDAKATVNGWINSPGHRANMLNTSFTHIGVGVYSDKNYATQMFIGK